MTVLVLFEFPISLIDEPYAKLHNLKFFMAIFQLLLKILLELVNAARIYVVSSISGYYHLLGFYLASSAAKAIRKWTSRGIATQRYPLFVRLRPEQCQKRGDTLTIKRHGVEAREVGTVFGVLCSTPVSNLHFSKNDSTLLGFASDSI